MLVHSLPDPGAPGTGSGTAGSQHNADGFIMGSFSSPPGPVQRFPRPRTSAPAAICRLPRPEALASFPGRPSGAGNDAPAVRPQSVRETAHLRTDILCRAAPEV